MISLTSRLRFMLVGLVSPFEDQEKVIADFEELQSLVNAFGGKVFAAAKQNLSRADAATYIGTGKAQEIAEVIAQEKIDIIVVNANVKPGQLYTLQKIFQRSDSSIIVWDKIDLILHIFSQHAQTAEAKLQIKFAMIRHMGPRIYGMGMEMSRQAGGIGSRGIGETNTELMERHWRNEIRNTEKQLKNLTQVKKLHIDKRVRSDVHTVSIVGYTNAGKTTLFNMFTGKNNIVDNMPFATLDSTVGKVFLPSSKNYFILSDTIGFIQDLPPHLIHAFKSTLMEVEYTDLILHVIDVSDPWIDQKINVVESILLELGVKNKNQIYVFNKIDKVPMLHTEEIRKNYVSYDPQFISCTKRKGIDGLHAAIGKSLLKTKNEHLSSMNFITDHI